MTNSLFVAYHLDRPESDDAAIGAAIGALGQSTRIYSGHWFLKSHLSAPEAAARIWSAMRPQDSVLVVDATNGEAGWKNLEPAVAELLRETWPTGAVSGAPSAAAGLQVAPHGDSDFTVPWQSGLRDAGGL